MQGFWSDSKQRARFGFRSELRHAAWISCWMLCACSLVLLAKPVVASDEDPPDHKPWFAGRVTGSAWLASVTGSLQTPRGGKLETTDPDRPTTEEIGLDGLDVFAVGDIQLFVLRDHEIHFRIEWADLSGDEVLAKDLTSQGAFFPAGSKVNSQLDTVFVRVGYRAHWLPLKWSSGSIAPEVGWGIVNFHYQLDSTMGTAPVDREYSWGSPYFGFLAQQRVHDRLDFEADVAGMAGVNGAVIAAMDLRALYTVYQTDRFKTRLVIGLAGTWLRRKDDQDEQQNDPNLRYGAFSDDPWAGIHFGLRAEF